MFEHVSKGLPRRPLPVIFCTSICLSACLSFSIHLSVQIVVAGDSNLPRVFNTRIALFYLCDSSLFVLYTCCYISVLENCVPIYNPTNDNDHASEYFPNDY